ncbi:cytochrome c class I [Chondrocystis sp. NIES-4102]|nr:cytochrome c class I [Chondrocystis sp. NIES-4102]
MDNQLVQSQAWLNRLILILMAVMLVIGLSFGIYWQQDTDPYVKAVLSLEGDPTKGSAIFQINCAGCHSLQANRNVGPRLENISKRKSPRNLIKQVTSGLTPPMPKFQPTQKEMADLLSYLSHL